jgi:hemin uptake protein HemP
MTKARDLADLIAAGNPLADGAISVSEISDLTATAADLNATNVTTLGTVEASKVVTADVVGDVKFPDGDKAIFGAGDDLQIYHDGSNSYIKDAGTGNLVLQSNFLGVHVQSSSGENMAQFNINDAVKLYFDSVKKLETTATGIDVTGNATFGDNGKALFGAGSDLQIYHNGSDSYVRDEGTGSLILQGTSQVKIQSPVTGENYAIFNDNGAVTLNYNNNLRFATNDLGADVTGEFIADSYNETYAALSGTSPAVNCETGNVFALSTSGNTTFTFTNPPASGTAYGFTLKVTAGGTHTLTWPSSVDWAGGTAPDAPASGETNVLVFITHDGGTTWYGFQAGAALA